LTREDCDRLDAWATSGVRVVVNATYLWFRPAAPRPRRAEVLISLHKLAGVGARLGVVTGERFFAEGVPELAAAGPPPGWQATWASFLASGGADLLMAANVVPAALAAQIFDEAAGSVIDSLTLAPSGPNRLLRLGDGLTENDVVNRLAERGFRVSPGSAFDSPEPAVRATFTGVSVDEARSFASVVSPGMRGLDIRSRRR
jgi:DNA-binding transcriptional MocR family regulator